MAIKIIAKSIFSFKDFWTTLSLLSESAMFRKPDCSETKERDCTTGKKGTMWTVYFTPN